MEKSKSFPTQTHTVMLYCKSKSKKSKSKSKKTLFKVGQCKQTTLALTWSEC